MNVTGVCAPSAGAMIDAVTDAARVADGMVAVVPPAEITVTACEATTPAALGGPMRVATTDAPARVMSRASSVEVAEVTVRLVTVPAETAPLVRPMIAGRYLPPVVILPIT